jgi:hypothetical protein
MPSRWEAYGLVAIETLAAGRRLLVNNVDGLTDHVPHGATSIDGATTTRWHNALEDLTAAPPRARQVGSAYSYEKQFANRWNALCLSCDSTTQHLAPVQSLTCSAETDKSGGLP